MLIFSLFYVYVLVTTSNRILPMDELHDFIYAIVLGAGLESDGTPTDILSDRVLSAVNLVKAGKAKKMILSGSKSRHDYDETIAMQNFAVRLGVSQNQIETDHVGNSTFESMVNFKLHFPGKDVVIVTQNFHLPRAIWIARSLGINAFGFAAQIYHFSTVKTLYWGVREVFALPFNMLKLFIHFYAMKNRTI